MTERPDPSGPSDAAVRSATGRGWDDWFARLDAAGAGTLDHKAIVAIVRDDEGLSNGWWQQAVTVAYEKARGLRATVGSLVRATAARTARRARSVACSRDVGFG